MQVYNANFFVCAAFVLKKFMEFKGQKINQQLAKLKKIGGLCYVCATFVLVCASKIFIWATIIVKLIG